MKVFEINFDDLGQLTKLIFHSKISVSIAKVMIFAID